MIVSPKELNELVNLKVQEQALEIERRILEKEKADMESLARTLRLYVDATLKENFDELYAKLRELEIKVRKLEVEVIEGMIREARKTSAKTNETLKPFETTDAPYKPSQSIKERRRESSRRANRKPKQPSSP